jgi:uncharacterized LabA/DUF88 family protein
MPLFGGAYNGPQAIRYLFIDGGCLRETLNRISTRWANGEKVVLDFNRFTDGFTKVFYYDALPARKNDEAEADYISRIEPERKLLDELSFLDRFHVYEGEVRRSSARRGPEQKKVDVMIAVDMLSHTFRRNMHEATLLTSDLDFRPLLDALVHEGMALTLWYPTYGTARDLIVSADRKRPLGVLEIHRALTSDSKAKISLPKAWGEADKGDFDPVLARWEDTNGKFRLMQGEEGYTLVAPNPNAGYATYYQHPNLETLRRYAQDVVMTQIPELGA